MIDIVNLRKEFDNGFVALQDINFTIEKGDLVCLLGPSGCGKSTILNLIAGLLTPTSGDIVFDGTSVVHTAPKDRNIGMVFQNYALYPHLTVAENVIFPLTVGKNKIKKEDAAKIADEYMALTNITDLADKKPGQLSGGQQQRVAITRALVQKPGVLLLDEPLSNLDARLRLQIREEIRKLIKKVGITAIFVTHDQEEALSISDKIIIMNDGVVQQYADPQQLYLEPSNLFVAKFIGSPIINTLDVEITDHHLTFGEFKINRKHLASERYKTELKKGSYTFAIRPEDIHLSEEDGAVKLPVKSYEIIGRDCIVRFGTADKQVVKVIVPLDSVISYGEERFLYFNMKKAYLFDSEGVRVY